MRAASFVIIIAMESKPSFLPHAGGGGSGAIFAIIARDLEIEVLKERVGEEIDPLQGIDGWDKGAVGPRALATE